MTTTAAPAFSIGDQVMYCSENQELLYHGRPGFIVATGDGVVTVESNGYVAGYRYTLPLACVKPMHRNAEAA